ncbi:MAG: class I SAM-dependent methyltransferase [Eubacterium sp.]|nr:class I SAM-dependent methyltransferase [Eubacterium sp.]
MNKLYKHKLGRAFNARAKRILGLIDIQHDKKLVGAPLGRYVPSEHRKDMGATGSESTPYYALRKMIGADTFTENDVFADIGCGKGRVLAYMATEYGFKGKIRGVELNEEVAAVAADWAKQFDNVEIIAGDAFKQDLSDITVMYLGRPFETEFFKKFIDKFESEMNHPVTLYYWVDQQSGSYLKDRAGWTREKRIKIYYNKCLPLVTVPQGFSKWTYIPQKTEKE